MTRITATCVQEALFILHRPHALRFPGAGFRIRAALGTQLGTWDESGRVRGRHGCGRK